MKYSELLELYKTGKLPEEQAKKVEADIERHVAIGDYLFDDEKIPELSDMFEETEENKNVVKVVRATVREAFIKLGVTVTAVVLAVVLFVVFALPKVVDCFYYNPTKKIGSNTEALSLDMAVYSELHMPLSYCDDAYVNSEGYGKYSLVLRPYAISYEGDVGGVLNKNEMVLYDPNYFASPAVNDFNFYGLGIGCDFYLTESYYRTKEELVEEYKEELEDGEKYIAYVTLNEVMNYQEFVSTVEKLSVSPYWVGICAKNNDKNYSDKPYISTCSMGFIYETSCKGLAFDKEKYPYLTQFSMAETMDIYSDNPVPEDIMTTHVISMLKYMADQKQFRKVMGSDKETYLDLAANIEENGLNIYGYVDVVDKETVLRLLELDSVIYVTVEE